MAFLFWVNVFGYKNIYLTKGGTPFSITLVAAERSEAALGIAQVKATGTSSGDILAANQLIQQIDETFEGAAAIGATWHHKSFDRKTGTFIMELVDASAHAKFSHSGGMAQYLDWVASVINNRQIQCLDDRQATAVLRTLKSGALGKRVSSRLADSAASFTVRHLRNRGYKIVISEAGEITAELVGRRAGRQLLGTVLKRGGAALPAIFILWSAGSAYAETGDPCEAGKAAVRELVMADLVEGAFQMTVMQGAEAVGDYFIKPVGHARKKYSQLTPAEQAWLIQQVEASLPDDFRTAAEKIMEQGINGWNREVPEGLRKAAGR